MSQPTTLSEAMEALDALLDPEDKAILKAAENVREMVGRVHHTLGRHLRNEWKLWHGSELANHLRDVHGISHPDDMSGFIIQEYIKSHYPSAWERLADE